jgi:hypothetical protein
MELQYYFKSPFTEDHPFYHVDLIFVTGPNDLLGTILGRRVLVPYDYRWVEGCVEKGELLDMGRYIVDFPIKAEMEGGEEDYEVNVDGGQVNPPPINHISNFPTSLFNDGYSSDPLTSKTSLPRLNDNLLRYPQRGVPPSAFNSEFALRKASFNPTSASRFRASTAPFTRPRLSTPTNAIAGPSKLKDESESRELDEFLPFDSSSQRVSSEESTTPILHIPYRKLDEIKFREFESRMKEYEEHDLIEFYQELMECGKDDKILMGLEAGL